MSNNETYGEIKKKLRDKISVPLNIETVCALDFDNKNDISSKLRMPMFHKIRLFSFTLERLIQRRDV